MQHELKECTALSDKPPQHPARMGGSGLTNRQQDRGPRGCAHREGGLGHLAAVVCDAPTQTARDAAAMLLPLAAHHRLHGVAAHADGSLWPQGTGDSSHECPWTAATQSPRAPGLLEERQRSPAVQQHPTTQPSTAPCFNRKALRGPPPPPAPALLTVPMQHAATHSLLAAALRCLCHFQCTVLPMKKQALGA